MLPEQPATPVAEQKKAENQRKTELLRAKLLAQRQNTPNKGLSRSSTPVKSVAAISEPNPQPQLHKKMTEEENNMSSDPFDLESLLAEGKANAEAKAQRQNAAIADLPTSPIPEVSTSKGQSAGSAEHKIDQPEQAQSSRVAPVADRPPQEAESPPTKAPQQAQPTQINEAGPDLEQPDSSPRLTDAYYADLPVWLEFTGYHDVDYRESKLRTYKNRKALEEEKARIEERLEKLRQEEQATIDALRATPAHHTATPVAKRAPPPLPAMMPEANAPQLPTATEKPGPSATNGIKRARSPEPAVSAKSRREEQGPGFRIRGANESPGLIRGLKRSPSPFARAGAGVGGLERRVSYPDAHRRSQDDYGNARGPIRRDEERDPSLERRQNYYKREPGQNNAERHDPRYAGGREPPRAGVNENYGRLGYSSVNNFHAGGRTGAGGHDGYREREYSQQYRGSAGLELRKGGKNRLH